MSRRAAWAAPLVTLLWLLVWPPLLAAVGCATCTGHRVEWGCPGGTTRVTTTYHPTSDTQYGTYTPATGAWDPTGSVVASAYQSFWGIIHFADLSQAAGGVRTGHALLTDATLVLDPISLGFHFPLGQPFSGILHIDVAIQGDAVPDATTVPRMVWRSLTTTTLTDASSATISLQTQAPGYGGEVRISDLLQAVWGRRDASQTTHSLTLRLWTEVAGLQGPDVASGITLQVTEEAADYGAVGMEYIADPLEAQVRGVVWDHKTGEPIPRDEAVRDGYTRALVRPENYDPPAPRGRRRWERGRRLWGS